MARSKVKTAALLLVIGLIPVAGAVKFQIGIDSAAEASVFYPQYENNTSTVHEFNVSLENSASVGCRYYLIGKFNMGKNTEVIRSNSYNMWAGDTSTAKLEYLPLNYEGPVDADIDIGFCSHQKNVTSYTFNVTERNVADSEFEAETVSADQKRAKVKLKVENGRLVPIKQPGYWTAGPAEIVSGTANIEYDAPLYQPREIEYAIIDEDGDVIGKTKVDTTPPESTWRDWLDENPWTAFAALLILSLSGNLYLLRNRIVPESVRQKLAEMEFSDRSVRK